MKKLIIQIPCYNEAETLPLVFKDMPTHIEGIDVIEYQIVDDCSFDNTVEVARSLGVHHLVRIFGTNRRWLGRAFKAGVDHALMHGADILVNTDGDNQYPSDKIADLVRPILEGRAHIVIGDRDPAHFREFSKLKRFLQRFGSNTIALVVGSPVPDAVSGFRAFSREALLKVNLLTKYTYTVDSLMQAMEKGLDIAWIKISPNSKTRDSRLITSIFSKVRKSGATILRMFAIYHPFKTFALLSALFLVPGNLLMLRFLYYYIFVPGRAGGFIQSLIVSGVLIITGFQVFVLGIIGDLLSVNRSFVEEVLSRLRGVEVEKLSSRK